MMFLRYERRPPRWEPCPRAARRLLFASAEEHVEAMPRVGRPVPSVLPWHLGAMAMSPREACARSPKG